jgi:hypothetical protein
MTKRYYSKRYTKKRRTKYLIIGLGLMFITLVAASAYSDIPQLEPIGKQIKSFKSGIGGSKLSVGETGETDSLSITLVKYALTDSWIERLYDIEHKAPKGAKFLFMYIKVENIGKTRTAFPCFLGCEDKISLHYAGAKMPHAWQVIDAKFSPQYSVYGRCIKYPGDSKEGWIVFEVPEGIELEDTTLEIKGLVWKLG